MTRPLLSFGVVADCQYADAEPAGVREYRAGAVRLREAMDVFDDRRPAFVAQLGDLIDRDPADLAALAPILASSRAPVLHVLGNHDLTSFGGERGAVLEAFGMPAAYYAHRVAGVRFLVLDTNEIAALDQPTGSPGWQRQRERLAGLLARGTVNALPWNGGVGPDQLRWLADQLAAAAREGERVVVLGHQPLLPAERHTVLNAPEVLAVLDRSPHVVAYLNGHRHSGDLAVHRLSSSSRPFLTFAAMVNAGGNAFAVCHLHRDRLDVEGFGREPTRSVPYRP